MRGKKLPLPFKGRVGVGMGAAAPDNPIPLLSSPLKGEGRDCQTDGDEVRIYQGQLWEKWIERRELKR